MYESVPLSTSLEQLMSSLRRKREISELLRFAAGPNAKHISSHTREEKVEEIWVRGGGGIKGGGEGPCRPPPPAHPSVRMDP